jgi:signal transduction histidine kinase
VQNFLLYGQLEMKASDPSSIAALLERVTRDPRQIIEARARRLAGRFQRAGDLQFEAAQAAVAIGQDLFTKLLDELVENAFKFSTAGTPVRISGAAEESNYCLTVTDQGRGLDPAQVAAIGAYTQFDRKENEQQGSGLGLTIARRIADLHGGQLTLKSARQAGTTVHVKLPLAAAKPAA